MQIGSATWFTFSDHEYKKGAAVRAVAARGKVLGTATKEETAFPCARGSSYQVSINMAQLDLRMTALDLLVQKLERAQERE